MKLPLIPNDPYTISNYITVPVPRKMPKIISQTVKAMVERMKPGDEIDAVNCTYTTTVQIDEPIEKLTEHQMQTISEWWGEMMQAEFERALFGQSIRQEAMNGVANNSVGAWPTEPKHGKSAVIADLTNMT